MLAASYTDGDVAAAIAAYLDGEVEDLAAGQPVFSVRQRDTELIVTATDLNGTQQRYSVLVQPLHSSKGTQG